MSAIFAPWLNNLCGDIERLSKQEEAGLTDSNGVTYRPIWKRLKLHTGGDVEKLSGDKSGGSVLIGPWRHREAGGGLNKRRDSPPNTKNLKINIDNEEQWNTSLNVTKRWLSKP